MITDNKILEAVSELKSLNESRLGKYYRNYRRYNYTPYADIENIRNPSIIGYWQEDASIEVDTNVTPQINVIKSCIDTLTSKISQSRVRPFFNTVNGTFKDIQIVKQAQQFFDLFYDLQDVNKKVSLAFRDSCVFDTGYLFVDPFCKSIKKVLPWQIFVRPAEVSYGKITRMYYEQKDYPVTILPEVCAKEIEKKNFIGEYVTLGMYFDTFNKVFAYYILETNTIIKETFDKEMIPLVSLHYCSPIIGTTSQSVVDMLNSLQIEIDDLMAKIKDASELTPANTMFVPTLTDISANKMSNRVGNIVSYTPAPTQGGSTPPVTVATPAFIDNQYLQLLEQYKQDAYEMVGISQLSAQSKKPSGLDSGVALSTMEDISSERFETQLQQVIHTYVDLAKICIHVFDKNDDVLPEKDNRISIKWADIVDQSEKMSIQYSGADALSKDPSVKLQQLQTLASAGVIPQSRISQFLEIPDLNSGYSLSNNAISAVMAIIDDCIEKDDYNVPDYVSFLMLKEEIINTQMSLRANNNEKNQADIDKLSKLQEIVTAKEEEWMSTLETPETGMTEDGALPQGTNVLTEEATMVQSPDLDMSTNVEQGW